jgi:hypothetical protein
MISLGRTLSDFFAWTTIDRFTQVSSELFPYRDSRMTSESFTGSMNSIETLMSLEETSWFTRAMYGSISVPFTIARF